MQKTVLSIGKGNIVGQFLADIASSPRDIRELFLVSPFVELAANGFDFGRNLCQLLCTIKRFGGRVLLISDHSSSRRKDFQTALREYPVLGGSLLLCNALHAKCGLATNSVGHQSAFIGSANLTDAGLARNIEVVFGMKGKFQEGHGWRLTGQLRLLIDRIRATSTTVKI